MLFLISKSKQIITVEISPEVRLAEPGCLPSEGQAKGVSRETGRGEGECLDPPAVPHRQPAHPVQLLQRRRVALPGAPALHRDIPARNHNHLSLAHHFLQVVIVDLLHLTSNRLTKNRFSRFLADLQGGDVGRVPDRLLHRVLLLHADRPGGASREQVSHQEPRVARAPLAQLAHQQTLTIFS